LSARAWAAFAAVSVLWGIPYLFIKVAVDDDVPPAFLAWVRVVLGAIVLVALLVCLIPTTIGALLSAIGIAGMDRLVQRNVLAMSGRAVEAGTVLVAAGPWTPSIVPGWADQPPIRSVWGVVVSVALAVPPRAVLEELGAAK